MGVVCSCRRDELCHECVRRQLSWHRGTAWTRGASWADSVARRAPRLLHQPWPALEGRCAEIAARWVVDLSSDLRVLEQLLIEVDRGARVRWEQMRAARRGG